MAAGIVALDASRGVGAAQVGAFGCDGRSMKCTLDGGPRRTRAITPIQKRIPPFFTCTPRRRVLGIPSAGPRTRGKERQYDCASECGPITTGRTRALPGGSGSADRVGRV